jgi:hypothetical protein
MLTYFARHIVQGSFPSQGIGVRTLPFHTSWSAGSYAGGKILHEEHHGCHPSDNKECNGSLSCGNQMDERIFGRMG